MVTPLVDQLEAAQRWPEQGQWTYEDWLRLPEDGFRYELMSGELLMSPPPSTAHQNAVSSLLAEMRLHARTNGLGVVLTSPIGVRFPDWDSIVQPDILFVTTDRKGIIQKDYIEGAPDMVVEVLSPSNWMIDRGRKQEAYRLAGVREYWIVDYRARLIDVFTLEEGDYIQRGQYGEDDTASSKVLAGFAVSVKAVFEL